MKQIYSTVAQICLERHLGMSRCRGRSDKVLRWASPRLSCLYPNPIPLDPCKALQSIAQTYLPVSFYHELVIPISPLVDLGERMMATRILVTFHQVVRFPSLKFCWVDT